MRRFFLFFSGRIIVLVIYLLACFLQKENQKEDSAWGPLERGFATTRKVYRIFSLQFFILLILLLIFDLEIIFVLRLVFSSSTGLTKSLYFMMLILRTL
jgi:NADH:ubiquinone oxidoreductase subunit 3 (subunit A)